MFILIKNKFVARVFIVVGGLASLIILIAITQLLIPLSCTLSAPATQKTPILLTCGHLINITDAKDDFVYDQINFARYVITPILDWTVTRSVNFTALPQALIPFPRKVSLPIPPIAPIAFFTESEPNGTTTIQKIVMTQTHFKITSIVSSTNISDVSFDGNYSLTYIKKDALTQEPEVNTYDLLANKETTFLKPLLGKTYEAFAPSGSVSDYGWIERNPEGKTETFLTAGGPIPYSLRDIFGLKGLYSALTYSGDQNSLLLIEPNQKQVTILNLNNTSDSPIQSPRTSSHILSAGFIGYKQTTPFVLTLNDTWYYVNNKWRFNPLPTNLSLVMCESGLVYFDTDTTLPHRCSALKITSTGITAMNEGVNKKIYESHGILQWSNMFFISNGEVEKYREGF